MLRWNGHVAQTGTLLKYLENVVHEMALQKYSFYSSFGTGEPQGSGI
jgi:hypothetical protein